MWTLIKGLLLKWAMLKWLLKSLGSLGILVPIAFILKMVGLPVLMVLAVLALPIIRSGELPEGTTGWSHIVVLPVVMLLVAVAVNLLAQQLFRQHARLEEMQAALTGTLVDLRERNSVIDGVLEAIDDTVVVLDAEGRITRLTGFFDG